MLISVKTQRVVMHSEGALVENFLEGFHKLTQKGRVVLIGCSSIWVNAPNILRYQFLLDLLNEETIYV